MNVSTDPKKIERVLTHQAEDVIIRDELKERLESGERLIIKLGADPSRPDLHLGHAVVLRKLRDLQDLGHKVVFIIGDFTGLVGDPTGKSKTRPQLTEKEIKENAKTYLKQVGKVLDVEKSEVVYNSDWLGRLEAQDFIALAAKFTVARILERDDFEKRMASGTEIHVHELLYPMLQAYDSVHLEAGVEVGATDQTFNMLAGRELMKKEGMTPQDVITCSILVGTDGVQKMSKSLDNYIALDDGPDEMYGKTMSIPDAALENWLRLAADLSDNDIETRLAALKKGENPRDVKAWLAKRIVAEWHGEEAAEKAEETWNARFRDGAMPEDIPEKVIEPKIGEPYRLYELVRDAFEVSGSQARKDIEGGGVRFNDSVVDDPHFEIEQDMLEEGILLQKGKRHFYRIRT